MFQQKIDMTGCTRYNLLPSTFLQRATWWIVAVTKPTLPGSTVAVLIRVRVGLDQLQPCGSAAMDQPDLAPAHTNT